MVDVEVVVWLINGLLECSLLPSCYLIAVIQTLGFCPRAGDGNYSRFDPSYKSCTAACRSAASDSVVCRY
jgi:hypothetical protein